VFTSFTSILSIGFNLLQALVPLFGVVFIASKVAGPARGLGIIGCLLLVVAGVGQTVSILLFPRLVRAGNGMGFITVGNVLVNLVTLAGLALVIAAICTGRAKSNPPHATYPR
jgi:hypothetical protein